jgi:Holliday junction resolvasome RuvABC endonuclease subunit
MGSDLTEHLFDSTLVAGCDPSSKKLAVVVSHPDGRVTTHVWQSTNKKWEPSSCLSASEWIRCEFARMDPGTIWIEDPVVGRAGIRSSVVQAFVSGAAQAAFQSLGWTVQMVNVQRWKAVVVGNGHASKDDIASAVTQHWPDAARITSSDGDLTDAAAIALYGRGLPPSA